MGILLGAWVGFSKKAARFIEPSVLSLIPVPPIAWIPLLIIIFGIGEYSKIALIAIGSFCTLFIHTGYGFRSADRAYVEVARVLMKDDAFVLRHVLLPSALPNILSSMRVAMALSWTLLMASEIIASSQGLGWLIWDSRNFSRPDDMIAGMVAVAILGKVTDSALIALERYLTRWRRTYAEG
jgi:sulfonate transport system permease protein